MPTSKYVTIPYVLDRVMRFQKERGGKLRILDLGIGNGIWGVLFRNYLDGSFQLPEGSRQFHRRESWETTIIGVEIYEPYLTPVTGYVYDHILIEDMQKVPVRMQHSIPIWLGEKFDLIFIGDAIEHISKQDGMKLLDALACDTLKEDGIILVVTPAMKYEWHKSIDDNPANAHVSLWSEADFQRLKDLNAKCMRIGQKIIAELTVKMHR